MPFIPNQKINTGLYVGTTSVWEINKLGSADVNTEEYRLLLVRLAQNLNSYALALNAKESGYYDTQEFVTGQQFFSTDPTNIGKLRFSFRLVLNVGALGASTTTVPHGLAIDANWTFTRMYGTASDNIGFNYYPIPYAGAAGAYIGLVANATNVVIDNNSGVVFTSCIVVLEYLKS